MDEHQYIVVPFSTSLTVAGLAETLFSAAVSQRKNTFTGLAF